MDQKPLEKARLVFKNREPLPVMFNPTEMIRERFVNHAKTASIGDRYSERLSMDLFLDSSYFEDDETDIQIFLQELENASALDSSHFRSPVCAFHWGTFSFSGAIDEFTVHYLKFLPNGIPTRAKVALTISQVPHSFSVPYETQTPNPFKEYREYHEHRVPAESGLWLAAWNAYGDPSLWRNIAKANHIVNPRLVRTGQSLIIPSSKKDS
jgi:hypothetical protein